MAVESITAPEALRFNIGRVLSVAAGLFGQNFFTFVATHLAISFPSYALSFWMRGMSINPHQGYLGQYRDTLLLSMLVGSICGAVSQAALTYGAIQKLGGQEISIGGCLRGGFAAAPKAVVAFILCWFMIVLPMIALIIPGIVIATMLWVYLPAIVVEDTGIFESFSRSRFLTKGRRWQIFGLFMVVIVLYGIVEILIFKAIGIENLRILMQTPWIIIGSSAISLLVLTYLALATAVGYYYLRAEKEGMTLDVARVFE